MRPTVPPLLFALVLRGSCYAFGAAPLSDLGTAAPISSLSESSAATGGSGTHAVSRNDIRTLALDQHQEEFANGSSVFGVSGLSSSSQNTDINTWSDDDFVSHNIGLGNAGPSEPILQNGSIVFETKEPVFSREECAYWIQAARDTIAAERAAEAAASAFADSSKERSRFSERSNAELGEARVSSLPPPAIERLRNLLQTRLYPLLESRYGISNLSVYDGLILGSIAPAVSQPIHRDASLLTLNIALSPKEGFTEGGTYIEPMNTGVPLKVDQGVALCHAGGVMHAGCGIRSGERWQMVLFCLSKDEPQIARRAHARGLELMMDENDLDGAKVAFETGLEEALRDHLLHTGVGQVHHRRGEERESFQCLARTAECYPASPTAMIAMGKMLLAKRRPRAALRRFDKALETINDVDFNAEAFLALKAQAWDARMTAARAAMLCAEYEASKGTVSKGGLMTWSQERLPVAMERIRASMAAAPQDDRLPALLERAEALLGEAKRRSDNWAA